MPFRATSLLDSTALRLTDSLRFLPAKTSSATPIPVSRPFLPRNFKAGSKVEENIPLNQP